MIKQKIIILLCLVVNIIPVMADTAGWNITTTDKESKYYGVIVANGRIGILPYREPFSVRDVYLNHVFDADGDKGVSRVLRGVNPFNMEIFVDGNRLSIDNVDNWTQTLRMKEAVHHTSFTYSDKVKISYDIRALRNMPYSGLITVCIEALNDFTIDIRNSAVVPYGYKQSVTEMNTINIAGTPLHILRTHATSQYRERIVSASSAFVLSEENDVKVITSSNTVKLYKNMSKGEKFNFGLLGSVCTDRDFLDPYNESDRQVIYGAHEGIKHLIDVHSEQWNELWKSDIIIEGDDAVQQTVRLALYNLYSSIRANSRLSVPPFGLTSQGYNGHVFWDTEIWMYPPLLFLNHELAKSMVDYRVDRIESARKRADINGYKGVMFPWESDDAGEEACPTWALTGPFEHHISGDIGIAAWNYYCMTQDKEWLSTVGYPLIKEIADFWISRVTKNVDGTYSINNVVCADEYAEGVDDNAFTNGVAIVSLENACKAAELCGKTYPSIWKEVADKICIHYFEDGTVREYKGYNGKRIKQVDVNLLTYPLNIITDKDDIVKNLSYYESKIDKKGPAMSFSIFAVQYARLMQGHKAYEMFIRSFKSNQLPPFGAFAETAGGTNPYFLTGGGGMLQAVINGFCGLEITDKGVRQLPSALPPHWKKLTIIGVGLERKTYSRSQK